MQGLREGRFDVGLQLPDHVVRAGLNGTHLCVLAAQSHPPDVALVASPTIQNIEQIDRGYENIDERLRAIGANIIREE